MYVFSVKTGYKLEVSVLRISDGSWETTCQPEIYLCELLLEVKLRDFFIEYGNIKKLQKTSFDMRRYFLKSNQLTKAKYRSNSHVRNKKSTCSFIIFIVAEHFV